MILFDAKLYHSGVPITSGTRYLLVGFCYTKIYNINMESNIPIDVEETDKEDNNINNEGDIDISLFGL
jgi:hypothetical protein